VKALTSEWYDTVYTDQTAEGNSLHYTKDHLMRIAEQCVGGVLDLGCGLGLLSDMIGENYYIGVDYSEVAIKYAIAHTHNPQAIFVHADLQEFIKHDVPMQTVVLSEVMEHIDFPMQLATYAKRNFRKRLVGSVPINMPIKSHLKPAWSKKEILSLFGNTPIYLMECCKNSKRTNIHWHFTYER
jgi:2-polyprenyl-3-methyl-5-hydroxy-6-metoxy-1,4-benzoquinol methylase